MGSIRTNTGSVLGRTRGGIYIRGSVGGSSAWTPLTPGTIVGWYDPSQLGYANDQAIDADHPLIDLSGQGLNALNYVGSVLFKLNQKNGLATLFFDGSSSLISSGNIKYGGPLPITIAFIIRTTAAANRAITSFDQTDNPSQIQTYVTTGTGFPSLQNNAVFAATGNVTIADDSYHSVIFSLGVSTYQIYVDGIAAGSGSYTGSFGPSVRSLQIGAGGPSASFNRLTGYIGELLAFAGAFNSTDAGLLATYLRTKWATP